MFIKLKLFMMMIYIYIYILRYAYIFYYSYLLLEVIYAIICNVIILSISILDSVMSMMEKYAQNLEKNVEERAQQLIEEKKKTDDLLYRLLPRLEFNPRVTFLEWICH